MPLTHEVYVRPAYHTSHSRHCADLVFYVVNREKKRGITFTVFTGWQLSTAPDDMKGHGAVIESHSPTPHEGLEDTPYKGVCSVTEGPCYGCGWYGMAAKMFSILVEGGTDALWPALERYYYEIFVEEEEEEKCK